MDIWCSSRKSTHSARTVSRKAPMGRTVEWDAEIINESTANYRLADVQAPTS